MLLHMGDHIMKIYCTYTALESANFVPHHPAEEGTPVWQGASGPVLEVEEADHHHRQKTFLNM